MKYPYSVFIAGWLFLFAIQSCNEKSDAPPPEKQEQIPIDEIEITSESNEVEITAENNQIEKKKMTTSSNIPLTIVVSNLTSGDGPVEMSIYRTEDEFPVKDKHFKKYRFKPKNGKLSAKIKDLAYGEFALAIYQDVDGSGKINQNLIGIPKEPYAFSNNFKPKLKAPSYDNCKFEYSALSNSLHITLL